nr:MAG TPA: hypothetical protein [Bacteriophage sp.]
MRTSYKQLFAAVKNPLFYFFLNKPVVTSNAMPWHTHCNILANCCARTVAFEGQFFSCEWLNFHFVNPFP